MLNAADVPPTIAGKKQGSRYDINEHICAALDFVRKWDKLIISSCPDFVTTKLWLNDDCIQPGWRKGWDEILSGGEDWDYALRRLLQGTDMSSLPSELVDFRNEIDRLSLDKTVTKEVQALVAQHPISAPLQMNMKVKKLAEVQALAAVIANDCSQNGVKHVLDLGAGQGYLSRILKFQYGLHVLAVDFDQLQTCGAQRIDDRYKQDSNGVGSLIHETLYADPESIEQALYKAWGHEGTLPPIIICGLHACGDLTPTIMRLFVQLDAIRGMACIGCCYNLVSVQGARNVLWKPPGSEIAPTPTAWGFPLSKAATEYCSSKNYKLNRHARMSSLQSTTKWLAEWDQTRASVRKSLYRAVFQKCLQDIPSLSHLLPQRQRRSTEHNEWEPDIRIGRMANGAFANFLTYAQHAIERLQTPPPQYDPKQLARIWEDEMRRDHLEARFNLWWSVRGLIGNVVESLIVLDRYQYLREQSGVATANLLCGFDEVKSPRNWILHAYKKAKPTT